MTGWMATGGSPLGPSAPQPHLSPSSSKLIRAAGADGAGSARGSAPVVMNECMFPGIRLDQRNPAAYAAAGAQSSSREDPAAGTLIDPVSAIQDQRKGRNREQEEPGSWTASLLRFIQTVDA